MDITSEDIELEERAGLLPSTENGNTHNKIRSVADQKESKSWFKTQKSLAEWGRKGLSVLWACILFLLPSFIARFLNVGQAPQATKLRSTAWLDGLRGLAAWAVFNQHMASMLYVDYSSGWGQGGKHHEIFRFPIISLLYSGPFAVALFFVISGYVLSIGPIHHMHDPSSDAGDVLRKTGSAIFRRPIRLLLPSWASNFLVMILVRRGWMAYLMLRLPKLREVVDGFTIIMQLSPHYYFTTWRQFQDVMRTNINLLQIYTDYLEPVKVEVYNVVTWTIPLELRSSLMLYLTHIMLYFMRWKLRTGVILFMTFAGVVAQGYDMPLFWAGLLIAKSCETNSTTSKRNVIVSVAWWILLLLGCFIGSFPQWDNETTPTYSWMIPLRPFGYDPGYRFFSGFGAALTLLAMSKTPVLIYMLSISPIQYLGRISFGLYLTQIWIINGYGTLIFFHIWQATGKESLLAHLAGFFLGYVCVLAICIWVADIFWRAFDRPSVLLGFWLEKFVFQQT